ncbi:MAG: transporter substrate-binding protein [Pirellulales bacterium]|nr:transporter substrate-binding protein [Pirellulales bacterium]
MGEDARLGDLLLRWERNLRKGTQVSPEELCRDCPELLDTFRERLAALGEVETLGETVDRSANSSVDDGPRPAGDLPTAPSLPGYEILGELGRGGMGIVYKARQIGLNRLVAIKMVLSGIHASPTALSRFRVEAEAVARLQHPNIVHIYDIGSKDGCPYFTLEFVEGGSVDRLLIDGPLEYRDAVLLAEGVARGLHHAHERGIVHRDLKPANVLLSGPDAPLEDGSGLGIPKLTDFGLAKRLEGEVQLTRVGSVMGTPSYMAPEQALGETENIGPGTDVYGLGVILYEMLTGQPPFVGRNDVETVQMVVSDDPEPISELRHDCPAHLEQIVSKCLEKELADRYPTAKSVADDLHRYLNGQPPLLGANSGDKTALLRRTSARQRSRLPVSGATRPSARPKVIRRVEAARRRSRRLFVGSVIAGFGGCVAAAIGIQWWPHSAAPTAVGADLPSIKVGVLHSLSGTIAISSAPVVDATLMAIDEVNAAGGLLGRKVEAVVRDGKSDWDAFAAEAERLITVDDVSVIFGCWTSAARKSVKPVVETNNHLLVYPLQYEGLEESPNILYVGAAPNQQIIPAVRWCYAFLDKRRFFHVGSDYVFPRAAHEIIKDQLKSMGQAELVGEAFLPLGAIEVERVAQQIVKAQPDVILNTVNGDTNVALFRALRAAGIRPDKVPVLSFSLTSNELSSLNSAATTGDYAAWSYFPAIERPTNQKFLEALSYNFNGQRKATDPMVAAYVGVKLWAQAVAAAGTDDVATVREALKSQRIDGPAGNEWVDPATMHVAQTARIGRLQANGEFEIIWSSVSPVAPQPFPDSRSRADWEALLDSLYQGWGGHWAPVDAD